MRVNILMTKVRGIITPEEMNERFEKWKKENPDAMSPTYIPIVHSPVEQYESVIYLHIQYQDHGSL